MDRREIQSKENEREGEGNETIQRQSHKVVLVEEIASMLNAWIISWGPARGGAPIVGGWIVMGWSGRTAVLPVWGTMMADRSQLFRLAFEAQSSPESRSMQLLPTAEVRRKAYLYVHTCKEYQPI